MDLVALARIYSAMMIPFEKFYNQIILIIGFRQWFKFIRIHILVWKQIGAKRLYSENINLHNFKILIQIN